MLRIGLGRVVKPEDRGQVVVLDMGRHVGAVPEHQFPAHHVGHLAAETDPHLVAHQIEEGCKGLRHQFVQADRIGTPVGQTIGMQTVVHRQGYLGQTLAFGDRQDVLAHHGAHREEFHHSVPCHHTTPTTRSATPG